MSRIHRAVLLAAVLIAAAVTACAQTYTTVTTLYTFTGAADGAGPMGPLVQGPDGNFYGTTGANYDPQTGALTGSGTFFKIAPAGSLTTLYSFNGTEASSPIGRLALGNDGNFYGTTNDCCNSIPPTVFRITPAGTLTTLYTFGAEDGSVPNGLVLGADGNFYGTTAQGGAGGDGGGGTIFRVTPTGTFTKLHDFNYGFGHGGSSPMAVLAQGADGNFYGTTNTGGAGALQDSGTVFKITPGGALTTLHSFDQLDGQNPQGALVLGNDGNFYGTTAGSSIPTGLPNSQGDYNSGTVFRIAPSGAFTMLPYEGVAIAELTAGLALGRDGDFYGVSPEYNGTVFQITPGGTVTLLYEFSSSPFSFPDQSGGLTLGSDGNFYGVTGGAGTPGNPGTWGTVYKLSVGSDPGYLLINANGVVNAASYSPVVAAGSIAAVFGVFPIASPTSAPSVPLPTDFSGLGVDFYGFSAPLFYGSMLQINVQVPWELAPLVGAEVFPPRAAVVQLGNEFGDGQYMTLASYAPGIFVVNATTGQGAILDANYRLVGPANPAPAGSYVQIYCTGLGPVTNQPATGSAALSDPLSMTMTNPTVTIGNVPADVVFSGLAPGNVGLYQVNVQVPGGAPSGVAEPLIVSIGGAVSNTATIAIQ